MQLEIKELEDLAEIEFADVVEDVFITDVNQFKRKSLKILFWSKKI